MANVLLFVHLSGSLTAGDTFIQSRLTGQGHTVTIVGGSTTPSFTGINLIVLSTSALKTEVGTKLDTLTIPVASYSTNAIPHSNFVGAAAGSGNTSASWYKLSGGSGTGFGDTLAAGANVITATAPASQWLYWPYGNFGTGAVAVFGYGTTSVGSGTTLRVTAAYNLVGTAMTVGNAPSFRAVCAFGGSLPLSTLNTAGLQIFDGIVTQALSTLKAAPTCSAGADQTHSAGKAGVTFTGTETVDASLTIVTRTWTLVSKPAGSALTTASLTNANTATVGIVSTAGVSGNYVLQYVVTDSNGIVSAPATVTLVTVANVPSAGSNQALTTNAAAVALDASASVGFGGTGGWTFSATNGVVITAANAAAASTTYPRPTVACVVTSTWTYVDEGGVTQSAASTQTFTAPVSATATTKLNYSPSTNTFV